MDSQHGFGMLAAMAIAAATAGLGCPDGQGSVAPRVVSGEDQAPHPVRRGAAPASAVKRAPPGKRAAAPLGNRAPKRFRIRFFSAGHGDGILMRTPGGHAVLVDAGRGNEAFLGDNLAQRRILPFCRDQGVRRLDAFIVTHPHWDHFGDPVTLRRALGVRRIHVNVDARHVLGSTLPAFVPDVELKLLHAPMVLRFGRLRLEVLSPQQKVVPAVVERKLYQQNNRSLVIRAVYGKHRFLLTGDLMRRGELRLLARGGPGRADVLKLGHHGIKRLTAGWLRAVRPRYAVASLGAKWRQRFDGLPGRVVRQLRRHRIKLLRTDRDGDVVFVSDGETLSVETYPELTLMPAWAPAWARKAVRKKAAGRAGAAP